MTLGARFPDTGPVKHSTLKETPMGYNIEGTFEYCGATFNPGDYLIVESTDYGVECARMAGTLDSSEGPMLVIDVEGESTVLTRGDLVSIEKAPVGWVAP